MIAQALAGDDWKKVYAIDTENRSLDLFDGITMSNGNSCNKFKKVDLLPVHGYAPTNYLACKGPAAVKKVPVAGRFADPEVEKIIWMRPHLLLTNYSSEERLVGQ